MKQGPMVPPAGRRVAFSLKSLFFDRFLSTEKKRKTCAKTCQSDYHRDRPTVSAEPGGEVRRGKLSGYGMDSLVGIQHASTPAGYGEFKSLREIAVPQGEPRRVGSGG